MLDFDIALELLNKYGYTSISVHPFVYQSGDSIGICYTYEDEDYGVLERISVFDNKEEFDEFLKKYHWYLKNGKNYNVRMILDNYEVINPKVIYLRNEKIMVEGEMFDIENYDLRESQRTMLDDVSKVIYEAGDLLLVYDEIKGRQLQYLKNIVYLKNILRKKYYELQIEVDKYNKYKVERNLTLLPDVTDIGINQMMEIAIKDKYNMYIAQRPSYDEAVSFVKEVWELLLNLELNIKYYEAQKEETDVRNELKVVEKKLNLMNNLNSNLKPLLGVDLVSRFRKINKICKEESSSISIESIQERMDSINKKYSFFSNLNLLYTSDYLREATQNDNYEELSMKYDKDIVHENKKEVKKALNEIVIDLNVQNKEKLDISLQAMMVLYNNNKYRIICDNILNIDNFEVLPIKQIIKKLNTISGFSKIKSECYDSVKKRINDPLNSIVKNSLFFNFDFSTYESFITSLVKILSKFKNINNKITLNSDVNMYMTISDKDEIYGKKFINISSDLNYLYAKSRENNTNIAIILLKKGTPVIYSPYYFDLGDIYSKNASPQMAIKEMTNFELLVNIDDILINKNITKNIVFKYYSKPNIFDNLFVVDDIKISGKTVFWKYIFNSKLVSAPDVINSNMGVSQVVEVAENNLVSSTNNVKVDGVSFNQTDLTDNNLRVTNNGTINKNESSVISENKSVSIMEINTLKNKSDIKTLSSENVKCESIASKGNPKEPQEVVDKKEILVAKSNLENKEVIVTPKDKQQNKDVNKLVKKSKIELKKDNEQEQKKEIINEQKLDKKESVNLKEKEEQKKVVVQKNEEHQDNIKTNNLNDAIKSNINNSIKEKTLIKVNEDMKKEKKSSLDESSTNKIVSSQKEVIKENPIITDKKLENKVNVGSSVDSNKIIKKIEDFNEKNLEKKQVEKKDDNNDKKNV